LVDARPASEEETAHANIFGEMTFLLGGRTVGNATYVPVAHRTSAAEDDAVRLLHPTDKEEARSHTQTRAVCRLGIHHTTKRCFTAADFAPSLS
jgi:hypothetical protein